MLIFLPSHILDGKKLDSDLDFFGDISAPHERCPPLRLIAVRLK